MKHPVAEPRPRPSSAIAPAQLAGKRAVALMFSTFPGDPRPRRAAEALVKEGVIVEVICLKETDEDPMHEFINGLDVTRIPIKHRRGGKLSYLFQYGSFILASGVILALRALRRRYELVHVHNMPDVLVFSALVPKILRAKVILDLHDPMPELMQTIFGLRENSFAVWMLKKLEKSSLCLADAAVTPNEAFKKVFSARSCRPEKVTVILNSPDEEIFKFREPSVQRLTRRDHSKPFIIMYHGSLVERYGLDLAVTALGKIRGSIPNAELKVYGKSTAYLGRVMNLAQKLGLSGAVRYMGPKNLEEIAKAISECDVGIIPNRRSKFTELNMPTRIFEYLSQGKPVVAPRTPGILDYFKAEELILFELGNSDDLAAKIAYVSEHPEEMVSMVEHGQQVYQKHKWSGERLRFLRLVEGILI